MDTEFAYWVPNVSGGLVVSDWDTETDWTYDYNLDLARTAESVGFDYALAQARFFGSYGRTSSWRRCRSPTRSPRRPTSYT